MRAATSPSHPTAEALIEAGQKLAEERGLSAMTVDAIVAAAGVAKGTFYVHFPDRDGFLVLLHRRFHDGLRERMSAATIGLPHGPGRLRAGTEAYLDGCLRSCGVKAILQEARSVPAILAEVRRADTRFSKDTATCLEVMGFEDAPAAARLLVAMSVETALVELESGKKRGDMRRALWRFAGIPRD